MVVKYSVRKRGGKWEIRATYWEPHGLEVHFISSKDSWVEAMIAVNFLISADRSLYKLFN